MKRRSLWGIIPGLYLFISILFFTAYIGSENLLPMPDLKQWLTPDPAVAAQRRAEKEARAAAKAAAKLAKQEAKEKEKAAREKEKSSAVNPVSLEAVSRYEAVTNAVIEAAYNRFAAAPDSDIETLNRRLPAMNAYRLQNGLTDFPSKQIADRASAFRGALSLEAAAAGAGDIVTAERNRRNSLAAAAPEIRNALQRKETRIFDNSRLIADLSDSRLPGFEKETLEPLLRAYERFDAFTPRQAAGFVDLCRRLNLDAAAGAADRLISQIRKEGPVYTVGNEDSVFCGQVLVAAGKWKQNQRWIDVGKTMVSTYWEAHPQTPFEEFYDLFDDRYFPKYRTAVAGGKEYRLYTCAENLKIGFSGGRISVQFDEPVGQTFFFLLYDLPVLNGYEMYNLSWNRDPNFQNYYAGAYFDANWALFFVKIMIKVRGETIYLLPQQAIQTGE